MIRPLRRQHRVMITLLALVLVVLFLASLVARKSTPTNPQIPNTLMQAPAGGHR